MKNELLYGNKEESINTASLGVFTLFAGILCQFSSSKNLQSFGKTLAIGGGLATLAQLSNSTQEIYSQDQKPLLPPIWKSKFKWSDVIQVKVSDPVFKSVYKFITFENLWKSLVPSHFANYYNLSQNNKLIIDCGDLMIRGLLDFAYQYKLPVHFYDDYKAENDPEFDNNNPFFVKNKKIRLLNTYNDFRSAIELNYGSPDIFHNNRILKDIPLKNMQVGDILSYKYPGVGWYHAQIVVAVDSENVMIYQGNLTEHGGDPTPVEKRIYKIKDIENKSIGRFLFFGVSPDEIKVRRWRFSYFDNFFKK